MCRRIWRRGGRRIRPFLSRVISLFRRCPVGVPAQQHLRRAHTPCTPLVPCRISCKRPVPPHVTSSRASSPSSQLPSPRPPPSPQRCAPPLPRTNVRRALARRSRTALGTFRRGSPGPPLAGIFLLLGTPPSPRTATLVARRLRSKLTVRFVIRRIARRLLAFSCRHRDDKNFL